MASSSETRNRNRQYVRQFNRVVLDYEMFVFEECQQKKIGYLACLNKVRSGKI